MRGNKYKKRNKKQVNNMEFINVPTINGTIREQIINVEELNINKNDYECIKKRNGGYYYNIPCTFDIEATTIEPKQVDGNSVLMIQLFSAERGKNFNN